ncbi:MAG TPA: sulfatase-like hydrolase/transferase [Thermoanaerobaculia bacterium]|jgi:arylsulfatase A-like enzyme/Tfp pilus assembly protein PilF|nr:sulfatase-like hydrolase/transferase [Thermoanaerobaculia bacterium]
MARKRPRGTPPASPPAPRSPAVPPARSRSRRALLLAAGGALSVIVVVAALAAWFGLHRSGPLGGLPRGLAPGDLNVLLITLDTTRADRLGCYGAKGVETPHLDALAAGGTLFERAIAPVPLTLPSHTSLMTAELPAMHGVRDNGGFRVGAEKVTLAEILAARGWATGGFVSAYVLDHRWGIAQGFDTYFDDFDLAKFKTMSMGDIQRRGDVTVEHALQWIGARGAGEKFFAWVHLYDPHAPYDPPEPFASRYKGHPYNGEIAWTDELVGRLLAGLAARGLTEKTIVAVIADHGESLGEHGEHGHGFFIYEPTTHVPLLLAGPYAGLSGKKVADVVRNVDLAPTLLDLLGLGGSGGANGGHLAGQGRSLVPLLAAGDVSGDAAPGYSEAFYSRFHYGWSELRSIRTDRWHFIEAPRPELYDLAADPGELNNLAAGERRTVADLRGRLAALDREVDAAIEKERAARPAGTKGSSAAAPLEEDEETLRKLAALGYVGSMGDAAAGKSFRDLPDPKDRLDVYNLMTKAREQLSAGKPDEAIATYDQVLARDAEVIDAWFGRGNAKFQQHRWDAAAADFRQTLARRPDHDYAMIGLADTLVATNRIDDAVLGYRKFLDQDPNNGQIAYRLAQVLLDAGRNEEAERWFVRTLEIEPGTARAEVGRAVVAFRKEDFAGSKAALDRALAIDPKARHARYNLALVRESEGDLSGAETAYRAEVADYPDAYKAWFNLGRLLARRGDAGGAEAAFSRTVAADPDFAVGRFYHAQALLDLGRAAEASAEARRGLTLDSTSPFAALGHYVLADLLKRAGRGAEAAAELRRGQALEAKGQNRKR